MATERQLDQQLHERLRSENLERAECGGAAPPVYVSPDPYATLRAAFHAGATIQAWHLNEGATTSADGRWVTLTPESGKAPEFCCPVHLYRVHPEDRVP